MVKNIAFFSDSKKIFLTYWKSVFWSLNIFVQNELFEKMPFSARKMHFFDKNGNLTPRLARTSADVKELFFREVILHQFLKRKKWALLGKNVQTNLTLLNFAQKVPFLEELKKKIQKVTGTKDILCMLPKYIIIHGFRSPLGQKCHNFG